MTPMIDIVFLLLIFFMTVTQVSEVNLERLELPQLAGSEDQRPTVVTINVMQGDEIRVSGEVLTLAGLVGLLERELTKVGRDPQLLTVVLRTDQRAESRLTNEVVRALGQLGIVRVRIAVETQT